MSVWSAFRADIERLSDATPRLLLRHPSPNADPEPDPPYDVHLTAGAVFVAQDLYDRFGDQVTLRVGALPYPLPTDAADAYRQKARRISLAHRLDGIRVALDGPLRVESGATANHAVLISNDTAREIVLNTNGKLTAQVLDLSDGRIVGGYAGWQTQPLKRLRIAQGETRRIRLLVGTASFDPGLGYAITEGSWGVTADLQLDDGRKLRLPVLTIEVTASSNSNAH